MLGQGAEVLGRYVCSTQAVSFLPFLIESSWKLVLCAFVFRVGFPRS